MVAASGVDAGCTTRPSVALAFVLFGAD